VTDSRHFSGALDDDGGAPAATVLKALGRPLPLGR